MAGAILAARMSAARHTRQAVAVILVAVALAAGALAVTPSLPLAVVLAVVCGTGSIVVEVIVDTVLARTLDEAVLARAYGLAFPASIAGIVVGALIAAPLVGLLGLPGALAAIAALLAGYAALLGLPARIRRRPAPPAAIGVAKIPTIRPAATRRSHPTVRRSPPGTAARPAAPTAWSSTPIHPAVEPTARPTMTMLQRRHHGLRAAGGTDPARTTRTRCGPQCPRVARLNTWDFHPGPGRWPPRPQVCGWLRRPRGPSRPPLGMSISQSRTSSLTWSGWPRAARSRAAPLTPSVSYGGGPGRGGVVDDAPADGPPPALPPRVCLRGDTYFSLTAHFDRWARRGVDFVFGMNASPTLRQRAENHGVADRVHSGHAHRAAYDGDGRVGEELVEQRPVFGCAVADQGADGGPTPLDDPYMD